MYPCSQVRNLAHVLKANCFYFICCNYFCVNKGDSELAAKHFCSLLNIDLSSCHFRLLPDEKLQWIRTMQHVKAKAITSTESPLRGAGIELQELEEGLSPSTKTKPAEICTSTSTEYRSDMNSANRKREDFNVCDGKLNDEENTCATDRKEWSKIPSKDTMMENRFAGLAGEQPYLLQ